jgi:hypothetical protein
MLTSCSAEVFPDSKMHGRRRVRSSALMAAMSSSPEVRGIFWSVISASKDSPRARSSASAALYAATTWNSARSSRRS